MGTRRNSARTSLTWLTAIVLSTTHPIEADSPRFIRSDTDGSGSIDVSDPILLLNVLFLGRGGLGCEDSSDANDDGQTNLTDAVYILNFLFLGGPGSPAPFPDCGVDPSEDSLGCSEYEPCESAMSEWPEIAEMYGVLEIFAGTGEFRSNGLNAWQGEFEGSDAREVELSRPHNAMADAAGNVYIADKDAHGIRKVRPDGTVVTAAGTNRLGNGRDEATPATEVALNNPNGVWVHDDGTFFVLDTGNSKIRRVGIDGIATTLFAVDTGIAVGRGLWVSDGGDEAFVSSGDRVLRWTPEDGVRVFSTGYQQLGNLTVSPDGELFVTDRFAQQVFRVNPEGRSEAVAGNAGLVHGANGGDGGEALETALDQPRGIFFHPLGGYFVAEHAGSRLWYVDTTGRIHLFVNGSNGAHCCNGERYNASADPKLSEIRNVTVDHEGNVLITENDLGFVRIVRLRESS